MDDTVAFMYAPAPDPLNVCQPDADTYPPHHTQIW